jgi:dTDP-glucose 4,6-dehydratase
MLTRLLVTGGAGFIGSNFVRHLLSGREGMHVVNLDALTYAGNRDNLAEFISHPNHHFVHGDISDRALLESLLKDYAIEAIVNFAAQSHVDRSLEDAEVFIRTNVGGTAALLEAARACGITQFLQISTDEVYGSLPAEGFFTETTPLHPNNPYSASKAGADLLVLAYHRTFGLPVVIARPSNNFGPYQFPEKLVPLMIVNALNNQPLPIYGDGQQVRDWLYVEDNCRALELILRNGRAGEVYNIGGGNEWKNIELVEKLTDLLDQHLGLTGERSTRRLITFVTDRLGHDRRYATDSSKIERELGWQRAVSFEEGLRRTVAWYVTRERWWRRIQSGEYRN